MYSVVVRICGILAVLAMAIVDAMNKVFTNNVWYAGVIGAMVIGPHLLDRVAGIEPSDKTLQRTQIIFAGLTIAIAAARFVP